MIIQVFNVFIKTKNIQELDVSLLNSTRLAKSLLLVTPITCRAIRVVDASASATALRGGSRHWSSGPRSCGASCAGSTCCGACPCRGGGGTSSSSCGCSGCLAVMVGMPLSFLDNNHNQSQ